MLRQLQLFTLVTIIFASCTGTRTAENAESISDFETKEYLREDSVVISPECSAFYKARIDIPVQGPQALTDSIRLWMAKQIIDSQNPDSTALVETALEGNLEKVIDVCSQLFLDEFKNNVTGIEGDNSFFEMSMEYSIKEVFRNENFVTFENEGYEYLGGAHGMPWHFGQTFYHSGLQLGWDMLEITDQNQSILKDMIVEALLKSYFKTQDWKDTGVWMADDPQSLPLPTIVPFLTEGGMTFIYGPYEIGPYAIGMPSCVIPLNKLAHLLNPLYFPAGN